MKHFLRTIALTGLACIATSLSAQDAHKQLRKGDKAYESNNYPEAEVSYRRALEKQKSDQGSYNLGNATYRQNHFDEAVKHYEAAANGAVEPEIKARAYHNLGNALFQKGEYPKSVEAYKNALRLNPKDPDTKRNLANAIRRLPPPPPPQNQNQQGKDKNKDKNQPQPQDQKPQQSDEDQPQDQQQPQDQEQPSSGSKEKPQDLSKEEAKQLLEIMDGEEQKVQQKLRKAQSKNKKSTKDW